MAHLPFVASLFFMAVRPRSIPFLVPIAIFFGPTPIHFLFGAFQPDGVGKGLFTLWLGGSLVYLAMRSSVMKFVPAVAISVCGAFGFTIFAHAGAEYELRLYPLLIAVFFGLVAATQSTHVLSSPKLGKSIGFFADYSFSLYLVPLHDHVRSVDDLLQQRDNRIRDRGPGFKSRRYRAG